MGNQVTLLTNRSVMKGRDKMCRLCLNFKDINLFGSFLDKNGKRYINSRCKQCASKVANQWGKDNRPRLSQKWKQQKEALLSIIHNAYGSKCNCCGETNPLFLTIDHVNNDGYKLRPRNKNGNYSAPFSGHYYTQIIKANFPKDLQLLCWNCNCGKARNKGICPHKM